MRKILLSLSLLMMAAGAYAVPAKRGIWKTLRLAGGGEARAELRGDEYHTFYMTADGVCYVLDAQSGLYEAADLTSVESAAASRRTAANNSRVRRAAVARQSTAGVRGQKKGLLILVEFTDTEFSSENAQALYNDILNADNYSSSIGFVGSVRDYFRDQSNGQLLLDFDVIGPVQLSRGYAYYGENSGFGGTDAHPDEMIIEACNLIDGQVNFADYDWDGDGVADQVCVLYAGRGEASGGGESTVWPHESTLSQYGRTLTLDGVKIDTYACSCELGEEGTIDGIGTFCHEFSHCLGIPDMYDTVSNGTNYGMYRWDIMSYGNYNGGSFIPSAYTSYERWVAGWMEPEELTEDTEVSGMEPLENGGKAYIIYNEGNRNEYYLLENRGKTGWDAAQAGEGLLVIHVDYDETVWNNNMVNTSGGSHQHLTPIAADNSYVASDEDAAGDVFPYNGNNSLTNTTKPAALLYNKNTDGSYFMNVSLTDITRNAGGTVSFCFSKVTDAPQPDADGNWFYESFNSCAGAGGNDGEWRKMYSGGLASGFIPDNVGWEGTTVVPGNACAMVTASVKSPLFYFSDGAELTFKAAPCRGYATALALSTDLGTLSQTAFTMTDGEWTEFRATLSGSGYAQLTFSTDGSYFIDEVRVTDPSSTGISTVKTEAAAIRGFRVYSLDGRYLGTSADGLGKGIYIINGKKIVK